MCVCVFQQFRRISIKKYYFLLEMPANETICESVLKNAKCKILGRLRVCSCRCGQITLLPFTMQTYCFHRHRLYIPVFSPHYLDSCLFHIPHFLFIFPLIFHCSLSFLLTCSFFSSPPLFYLLQYLILISTQIILTSTLFHYLSLNQLPSSSLYENHHPQFVPFHHPITEHFTIHVVITHPSVSPLILKYFHPLALQRSGVSSPSMRSFFQCILTTHSPLRLRPSPTVTLAQHGADKPLFPSPLPFPPFAALTPALKV